MARFHHARRATATAGPVAQGPVPGRRRGARFVAPGPFPHRVRPSVARSRVVEVVTVLVGSVAALREVRREDLSVFHGVLGTDPAFHANVMLEPWVPTTVAVAQARYDAGLAKEPDPRAPVQFTVQSATDNAGRCLGWGTLWGIDLHQRIAHIGVGLIPAARGRGLGLDAVRLLCRYAFEVRDLHRVGLETFATNEPMRRTALAAGFTQEGVLRESGYAMGERIDEVLYGLLRSDWKAAQAG